MSLCEKILAWLSLGLLKNSKKISGVNAVVFKPVSFFLKFMYTTNLNIFLSQSTIKTGSFTYNLNQICKLKKTYTISFLCNSSKQKSQPNDQNLVSGFRIQIFF